MVWRGEGHIALVGPALRSGSPSPQPISFSLCRESSREQPLPACLPVSILAGSPAGSWEPGSPKLLGAWPHSLPTDWVAVQVTAPLGASVSSSVDG